MINHQHSLIKATIGNPPRETKHLNSWLKSLVRDIDMKVLMGPYSKYLDVEGNRGISGMVMIETSHISCHIWDETSPALLQMDVYSCKAFDEKVILTRLEEFCLLRYQILNIDRNKMLCPKLTFKERYFPWL